MARFITLMNWTDQGVRNARDTVKRLQKGRSEFEAMGVRITDAYWTLGAYDLVLVTEAPDNETMARAYIILCGNGNVRTQTMPAFGEAEMTSLVAKLP